MNCLRMPLLIFYILLMFHFHTGFANVCNHDCVTRTTCRKKPFNDTCFYLFTENQRNWQGSKDFCQVQNLKIASLSEEHGHRNFTITDLVQGLSYGNTWLGSRAKILQNWTFVNGVVLESSVEMGREADPSQSARNCATVKVDEDGHVNIEPSECSVKRFSICRCEDKCEGTVSSIKVLRPPKTWFEARLTCKNIGGDLLYLEEEEDMMALKDILVETSLKESFYIGLYNREWSWLDGSPVLLHNWDFGQPNNIDGDENCLMIYGSNGKLNDYRCSATMNTLCQSYLIDGPATNGIVSTPTTAETVMSNTVTIPSTEDISTKSHVSADVTVYSSAYSSVVIPVSTVFGVIVLLIIIFVLISFLYRKKICCQRMPFNLDDQHRIVLTRQEVNRPEFWVEPDALQRQMQKNRTSFQNDRTGPALPRRNPMPLNYEFVEF